MKASVETVSPTRVKLSVEVPFEELQPQVDAAYKRLARSVKVPGFRPGKIPPKILEQRIGRGAVLEEAIQQAIPQAYAAAVEEQQVRVVSRPEVELDSFADGAPLVFSATVDVRPEFALPSYEGLSVGVDDATASDDDIANHLGSLQDRFATLAGVERAVQAGDYVVLDISATIDGEPVEGSEATGLSYEVGSDSMVPGLDEALVGLTAGEQKVFDADVRFGVHSGQTAQFTVTPTAVKEKSVPSLDDDFAQTASEFDTIDELRGDIRSRLERVAKLQQGVQAREKALETLLDKVEVPLPESLVHEEAHWQQARLEQQLEQAGLDLESYAARTERTVESISEELHTGAAHAVKAQLVLDAVAEKEQVDVSETELMEAVVRRAQRVGIAPQEFAQRISESGQVGELVNEIRRAKALGIVLESAVVTDGSGRPVDLAALEEPAAVRGVASLGGGAELQEHDHDHDHDDHEGHNH